LASTDTLPGGGQRSYGYGRAARLDDGAPVFDVRRATQLAAPDGVGAPYQISGRWYIPAAEPDYDERGQASWYGPTFHGQPTATGEIYDQEGMTAAHPTLPLGSRVEVTNLENGRQVTLRINDRGPFVGDRLIDVSHRAAEELGFERQGQARVRVRYLGMATPSDVTERARVTPVSAIPEEGPRSLLPPPTAAEAAAPPPTAPTELAPATETAQAAPMTGYYVQVGAYRDQANAARVEAAVTRAGQAWTEPADTASGRLFRVRVGPLASRGDAETARQALADLGYGEAVIAAR
jgi:rare lipoprotein A